LADVVHQTSQHQKSRADCARPRRKLPRDSGNAQAVTLHPITARWFEVKEPKEGCSEQQLRQLPGSHFLRNIGKTVLGSSRTAPLAGGELQDSPCELKIRSQLSERPVHVRRRQT